MDAVHSGGFYCTYSDEHRCHQLKYVIIFPWTVERCFLLHFSPVRRVKVREKFVKSRAFHSWRFRGCGSVKEELLLVWTFMVDGIDSEFLPVLLCWTSKARVIANLIRLPIWCWVFFWCWKKLRPKKLQTELQHQLKGFITSQLKHNKIITMLLFLQRSVCFNMYTRQINECAGNS